MKDRRNAFVRVVLIFLLAALLNACSGRPLEGSVIDATTGKPVPNAIVVGHWDKDYLHGSACVRVETHTTDEQGRFRLASYWGDAPDLVYVYARNFEYIRPNGLVDYRQQLMKPFVGSNTERLGHLKWLGGVTACDSNAGSSQKNLLPLKRLIYQEAESIASSSKDREIVETLLFGLESLEYGSVEALNRMTARRKGQK